MSDKTTLVVAPKIQGSRQTIKRAELRPASVNDLVDALRELGAEEAVLRNKHRTHWLDGVTYLVFRIPVDEMYIVCKCGSTFTDRDRADEHRDRAHAWEDQVDM